MRRLALATPHFTDRVAEAHALVASPDRTPMLADADRELLDEALRNLSGAIIDRAATEQPLHGEPHPGNLLATVQGPVFIDLETCCRGPIEFDLAHAPDGASDHYPRVDRDLLHQCHGLTLAMVAAWRWDRDDEFPDGHRHGRALLAALRAGSPWPTLDTVTRRVAPGR